MKTVFCAFCDAEYDRDDNPQPCVPHKIKNCHCTSDRMLPYHDDEEFWTAEAKLHGANCSWIKTRAYQLSIKP